MALGYLMIFGLAEGFQNDLYAMAAVVTPRSYLWTAVLVPVFVLVAQRVVVRALRRARWIEDLGAKE